MCNRLGMVCVSMSCFLLLAACDLPHGGSSGSGSGGRLGDTSPVPAAAETPPPAAETPSPAIDPTYGTHGQRIQAIRAALPALETCVTACGDAIPTATGPFRSPFGTTAAYDPDTDGWTALWSGEFDGYSHSDPESGGLDLDRGWSGTAALEIGSADLSRAWILGENLTYFLKDGRISNVRPDHIPDLRRDAWSATLSTAPGRKGYFSGNGIHGQFDAAPEGTAPERAIGHIHRDGHTGVFVVRR